MKWIPLLCVAACADTQHAATLRGPTSAAPTDVIMERVHALLSAYGTNDPDAVVRLCDARVVVYGSDVAEVARGTPAVREMMRNDFQLWGTAHLGEPRDIDVQGDRDIATAFFNVPFQARDQPEVVVRMATVWRNEAGSWLLVTSSNVVPTTGSSAAKLLGR